MSFTPRTDPVTLQWLCSRCSSPWHECTVTFCARYGANFIPDTDSSADVALVQARFDAAGRR